MTKQQKEALEITWKYLDEKRTNFKGQLAAAKKESVEDKLEKDQWIAHLEEQAGKITAALEVIENA
jgi:hypothetical protein